MKPVSAAASMSPQVKALVEQGHRPERIGKDAMLLAGYLLSRRQTALPADIARFVSENYERYWG